ncbi:MAG: DUF2752 domain-containing protein [Coriobacteriia bacterium]|nr:DUF2752 domain-containing protein [Coriobacteriia bacterium]
MKTEEGIKLHAKKTLAVYGVGIIALIAFVHTPFRIPCISKLIANTQCPGCGLTRSFVMAGQLDFIGAITMNILFLPLSIGMVIYFVCVVLDAFAGKRAIQRFNSILSNKWIIAAAVLLMLASWYYNFIRGI